MKLTDKPIIEALKAGKAIAYNERIKEFEYVMKRGVKLVFVCLFHGKEIRTFRFEPGVEELENDQWMIIETD